MDLVGPRYIKDDGKFYSINLIDTTTHSYYVKTVRTKSSAGIVEAIASFWKTHGMPDALQMDNELAFRDSNRYPFSFGKVVRFALNQGVAESDKVSKLVNIALSKGEHLMACNQSLYFIDKSDVHFFKLQNEAKEFATKMKKDKPVKKPICPH